MCIGLWVCCRETATVTVKMSVSERPPLLPPELCDHTQVKQMTFKQENSRLLLLTLLLREKKSERLQNTPTETDIYWGKSNQVLAEKYTEALTGGRGRRWKKQSSRWRMMRWRRWQRKSRRKRWRTARWRKRMKMEEEMDWKSPAAGIHLWPCGGLKG